VARAWPSSASLRIRRHASQIGLGLLLVLNGALVGIQAGGFLAPGADVDFGYFARAVTLADPYAAIPDYAYRWSPVMLAPLSFVLWIGIWPWRLLHVIAAATMPSWPLRIATLVSWPFLFDLQLGNLVTFVLWFAAWGLRGRWWGIAGFLALTLLVPRPLMLPVAAFLLWRHRDWWLPFACMFAVHAALVAASGLGPAWLDSFSRSAFDLTNDYNLAPTRWLGIAWLPVGLALAAILTLRGRLGLASMMASPYWLPYYGLLVLLEVRDGRAEHHRGAR
jgi:hypothetical protein